MTRLARRAALLCALLAWLGCGEKEFERPDPAERVSEAETLYTPAMFDTVTWVDEQARARAGNEVFASHCRNCHGTLGEGGTRYAEAQGLAVPSLVEPEWPLGASLDSVRHRIFVGHELGMPTWGIAGISPREIDGAAFYLLDRLRPEMLSR